MLKRAVLLFLLLPLCLQASSALPERLLAAGRDAEQISNQLLSQPTDTLTAEDWLILTEAQRRLRNKEAAMDAVNRALQSSRQPYLQAYAYLLKAQVYGILYRDTAIAITQLELAERLLKQAEDSASLSLYSEVLQSFAQAYNQLGDLARAVPYAEQSLTLALRQQNSEAELNARIILGRLLLQNNAFGQAYQQLQQALVLATQLQDNDALASIHLRLGMAYRKIEDHSQALVHLQHAKTRYLALNNQSSYVYTLIYIGETYLEDAASAGQASDYLQEALTLAHQQDDALRVAIVKLALGRLAVLQQQPDQAKDYFFAAMQLFRQQNVQTYLQETHLALAELLLQQDQPSQAAQLLTEHAPQMPKAATYLRYRYHELSARIAATLDRWPDAYQHLLQASAIKFEQISEQNALQLDILNKELTRASNDNQLHNQLQQSAQQLNQLQRQQQRAVVLCAAVGLLSLLFAVLWWRARKRTVLAQPLLSDWQQFCQHLQHQGRDSMWLLAITTPDSLQLKRRYGEQPIQQLQQQFIQQLTSADAVLTSCISDDVLWLALSQPADNALQQRLLQQLRQVLPASQTNLRLLSLALPVAELLGANWRADELTALREVVWLSLDCCEKQPLLQQQWLLRLHSKQPNACEWRSNLVRQDVLSALQLGDLNLICNGQRLGASCFDLQR